MNLSDNAKSALVRFLARVESPWRPLRRNWERGPAAYEARRNPKYRDGGDDGRRKMSERLRAELIAAGLMDKHGLTPAGKLAARGWTLPYDRADVTKAIDRIQERAAANDCRAGGWVCEAHVAGCQLAQWPDPFADLQTCLIMAIADGVVKAASTTDGLAFYRLAVSWPDESDRLAVPDESWIDDRLQDIYWDEYAAVWQGILNDDKYYPEIGDIPLPASGELLSGRDIDDVSGIPPLFADMAPPPKPKRKTKSKV